MRKTLPYLLSFLYCSLYGQQLEFRGNVVDAIVIESNESIYQFDQNGTTNYTSDVHSIVYNSTSTRYFVDRSYREKSNQSRSGDSREFKINEYNGEIGKKVSSEKLKILLTALSANAVQENLMNQIDTTKLNDFLIEKHIRKVAKSSGIGWYFRRRFSTKEENIEFYNSLKSLDTLKLYLKERFMDTGYPTTSDYSNAINIRVSTTKRDYWFEGKYPNPIRLPWYDHNFKSTKLPKPIVSPRINQVLFDLLPRKFLLKETISNKALAKDYILWYFKRRQLI